MRLTAEAITCAYNIEIEGLWYQVTSVMRWPAPLNHVVLNLAPLHGGEEVKYKCKTWTVFEAIKKF